MLKNVSLFINLTKYIGYKYTQNIHLYTVLIGGIIMRNTPYVRVTNVQEFKRVVDKMVIS